MGRASSHQKATNRHQQPVLTPALCPFPKAPHPRWGWARLQELIASPPSWLNTGRQRVSSSLHTGQPQEGKGKKPTYDRDSRTDGGNPCLASPHSIGREGGWPPSSEQGGREGKLSDPLPMCRAASPESPSPAEGGGGLQPEPWCGVRIPIPEPSPSPPNKQILRDCLLWGFQSPTNYSSWMKFFSKKRLP